VRESLFARLGPLEDLRVLDLFAGTGALGIEALSRGADSVAFVDRSERSLGVLRKNLRALGLEERPRVRVIRSEVVTALGRLGRDETGPRFDLVFLDPPYETGDAAAALTALAEAEILAPDAVVVVETATRHSVAPVPGLSQTSERRYGDTLLTWLAPAGANGSEGDGNPR
jgi:16S rRNA (guanine966-N2)-methyltransferase